MGTYLLRRMLAVISWLLAMTLIPFVVMHAIPVSPFDPAAFGGNDLPPEVIARIEAKYGLDKPLPLQYFNFIAGAMQGDFGYSTSRLVGPNGKLVTEVTQQQLAQNLGPNIKLKTPEDGKVFFANLFEGKYQFVFYIWYTDYPDPSNHYTTMWYGDAVRCRFAWKSDAFDKAVGAATGELDKNKRAELYLQAERALRDDSGYIPLYYPAPVNVYKPYVQGIPQNKSGVYVTDNSMYRAIKNNYIAETS